MTCPCDPSSPSRFKTFSIPRKVSKSLTFQAVHAILSRMNSQPLALKLPQPNTSIRPVQREDTAALSALWPHRTELDVLWLIKRAQQQATQGRGLGIVVTDERSDEAIAYGQITLWHRAAEIADLAVLDCHRCRGLGTVLVQHLVTAANQMHAKRIEIGVAISNPRALALYHRLGFLEHRTVLIDLGHGGEPVVYLNIDLQ